MASANPERDQDRAEDLLDNWRKYGYVMFPQQRAIYWQLAERLQRANVLEVGCGAGTGTAILAHRVNSIVGTDKSKGNVGFAKALYPWIEFGIWDISQPPNQQRDVVVAVEVLEHVANPVAAMRNLLAAAKREIWISTPNGTGKPRPPENPCHCAEYAPREVLEMIVEAIPDESAPAFVEVLGWEDFRLVLPGTNVDPLVYHVRLS